MYPAPRIQERKTNRAERARQADGPSSLSKQQSSRVRECQIEKQEILCQDKTTRYANEMLGWSRVRCQTRRDIAVVRTTHRGIKTGVLERQQGMAWMSGWSLEKQGLQVDGVGGA